ncbi:response regulator [Nisaea sp.]|uniref:response regulator n=1 Tax=Nisaea sp. TaxID=2024842 RepID=UPI003B52FA66
MLSVLIVDDDKPLRDLLAEFLREHGHDAQTAEEGQTALDMMSKAKFDLVLSDIIMPGKEGIETIREIREFHPDVRVIAMSTGGSLGNAQILEYARMIGAHEAIRKPIELPALVEMIAEMFP